jgi:hypothetical protein
MQLHCGGHLGGRARLPDIILEKDHQTWELLVLLAIVFSVLIYGFLFPLWYLQTLLMVIYIRRNKIMTIISIIAG